MATGKKTTSPAKREVIDETGEEEVRTVTFPFVFQVNGKEREVELTCIEDINEADPEAYLAYNRRDYPEMMKWMLGEMQWNMLRRAGLKFKHVPDLFTAWAEATGAGEE